MLECSSTPGENTTWRSSRMSERPNTASLAKWRSTGTHIALSAALRLSVLGAAVALVPVTAQAQTAEEQAEAYRLQQEIERLSQRGAWSGVETKYEALLRLGVPPTRDTHLIGAQSAGTLGKTLERYQRLRAAREIEEDQEILDNLSALDAQYGRVRFRGNPRWEVRFSRPSMPFAPDQRKSVEYAIYVLENGGEFEGMLPLGDYLLGADDTKEQLAVTVEPGPDFQTVQILRDHASGGEGIVYHGPVATVGYSLTSTPEPGDVVLTPGTDVHSPQPASLGGSGFGVELGYEIGPTRLIAAAVSVSYGGLYGTEDVFHQATGWAAAVLRPGDLRIAVGPTYGFITGKGTGVVESFDIGQDTTRNPPASTQYSGSAWMGGARLSAGYGLLDFDPFQGVVAVDGAWSTDTARSYFVFGVRTGIVPKAPRFEG